MAHVGEIERSTQNRVVDLFVNQLGYTYLGIWETRDNSNIEEGLLTAYLKRKGYDEALINRAIYQLKTAATNFNESLYTNNKNVYDLLRYGVKVKADAGENYETVHMIDWKGDNDYGVAEEVTIRGRHEKRPDVVLYVNGIAVGVLELKRSTVSIMDGITQNITNQQKEFIEQFFTTIQLVMAGNNWEGLRYGTIGTPAKYFLKWKEDEQEHEDFLLDKYLKKICSWERLLEIIYDFVLFDGGIKKLCRPHQYFGIKAAQAHVKNRESGIIWHTQGSGKSLTMVWLAKWILENNHRARVVVITDRDELDKQIEQVFKDAGETSVKRTRSGRDLMEKLNQPLPRLLCTLVHKFGNRDVEDFGAFIEELKTGPVKTVGDLFVFVDECHRTQSGKLHKTMKALLPKAVFIGFTGTPLLMKDKQTSLEVFGKYIHTYKFNEAVDDEVIRDLVYEARDIDQKLSSTQKVDEWFDVKTRGLNDYQKGELKKRWGTMQKVLSSRSRMEKIVSDIVLDFNVKPRLNSGRGNAILVAASIFDACRYFELFQSTELKGKCAVVTSYDPSYKDLVLEDTGGNTETEKEAIYRIYKELVLKNKYQSTEDYEDAIKDRFKKEPAHLKLMIVVDKLLTGFDAPPCTYLYIDKSMKDHGLFQAICRVNRLDTDDKQFGYIIDYKNLFEKVEHAVAVYTSDLDYDNFEKEDVQVMLENRLTKGKETLDSALEELELLCEPVPPPKDSIQYVHYFCGNPENPQDLKDTEFKRTALYKHTVALVRAFANISSEMEEAGYSRQDIDRIKGRTEFYIKLREEIRLASGETLDLKPYEADMRHLLDTYIQAEESRKISAFEDNQTLLDLIVRTGMNTALEQLPEGLRRDKGAMAETIENNVRQKIIKEQLTDPAYYERMSKLLDEIIKQRKANALSYEQYLAQIAALAKNVQEPESQNHLPPGIRTGAQRALYNNLNNDADLALNVDAAVVDSRQADWRGNKPKENLIKAAIYQVVRDEQETLRIFAIVEQQKEY